MIIIIISRSKTQTNCPVNSKYPYSMPKLAENYLVAIYCNTHRVKGFKSVGVSRLQDIYIRQISKDLCDQFFLIGMCNNLQYM